MSPTLFLVAGHCTAPPVASVEIWFQSDVQSGIPGNGYPLTGQYSGTPYTHPQYGQGGFFRYDVGVVVLNAPVPTQAIGNYGALPQLDAIDQLAKRRGLQNVLFTAVGYGAQYVNPVFVESARVRMYSTPHLIQINGGLVGDYPLLLSNNHATGGMCYGDSGGPNFIGTSNVVGGITSFGLNGNCRGVGGVTRVDRADALNWLATFATPAAVARKCKLDDGRAPAPAPRYSIMSSSVQHTATERTPGHGPLPHGHGQQVTQPRPQFAQSRDSCLFGSSDFICSRSGSDTCASV